MKTTLVILLAAIALPAWADDDLPSDGFQASRYEKLWTKSPFSVATPDAVDASPDYSLVGITVLEGISYASIVDAHTQDHFIVSSKKEMKGLKLSTISRGADGKDTYATVLKDGQPLTLKLSAQSAAPPAPGMPGQMGENAPPPGLPAPAPVVQNIPMPGANNPPPGAPMAPGVTRPFSRLHRSPIHLPPVPAPVPVGQAPPPGPVGQPAPQGAPVQPHAVPPQ